MNGQQTIGSIVAEDYRTATVFSRFNIDFCCKGGRTIDEVCRLKNVEPSVLLASLTEVKASAALPGDADVQRWKLSGLVDHIEQVHHKYVRETTPVLSAYLRKVAAVHGDRHPELREILSLFTESALELLNHMIKEETVLFPAVRRMEALRESGGAVDRPFYFGTVQNPISKMQQEHTTEGERFERIATLSNGYTPPEDACNTYKVAFAKLKEFQDDLHRHIHLENNLLFPKSIGLEQELQDAEPEYSTCSCSVPKH